MKCLQLFVFSAILVFALAQAHQAKIETSVLKHATHCSKRVSPKSTIQIQLLKTTLDSDEVPVNETLQIAPGEATFIKDLGLEKEILGMCVGEIRRFTLPAKINVSDEGKDLNRVNAYDIEVLEIENPPFFTPLFWAVLAGIGVTYPIVCILAKREDVSKNLSKKKSN